jgi:hypothetical protein
MSGNTLVSLGFAGAIVLSGSAAFAAPTQLYGKSVVVSWTEEREQRVEGEATTHNVGRNGSFSVYVSSAGKPFSRMSFAFSKSRGGLKYGKKDAVGGEGSGNRKVTFSGNSMSVGMGMQSGARSILVTFDGGFQGCSAQVLTGKESGASSIKAKSLVDGTRLEIISVKTGAASCKIQDGNVFGSE